MALPSSERAALRTALWLAALGSLIPIVVALLRLEAQRRGLLTLGQGLFLMTALTVVLFVGAIWWGYGRTVQGLRQLESRNERLREQAEQLAASHAEATQAQHRLQATLTRVELAEAVTQRGTWEWDVATNKAEWSKGMYALFGVDAATFDNSNENFLAMVLPEDRGRMGEAMAAALASPGRFHQEYRLRRPDGTVRHLEGVGDVAVDASGKPQRLFGVVQDVTELRRAQADRQRAQERFQRVFEASPVPIGLTKEDGRIVAANSAFCQLTGYALDELLDASFRASMLYDDAEERLRILNDLRQAGAIREREVVLVRKDGSSRTILAAIELVDVGGDTTILSVFQDITERQAAQQKREERIANEAEMERLRRTDQFRSHFINNTAHELSTPLTPLVLSVKTLLQDPALGERQRRQVETMERSVIRLKNLVADMLGAADVQARTLSLDKRRLNLNRELKAAVAAHEAAAHRANVDLLEPEDGGETVVADPQRLQLVLGHLLGNALKFTPAGGRVWLATRRSGEDVRISINDTGAGLTAKQMEGLWKPFAQAHDKMQRTQSGSGLGLYVTRGIIELHGGEVGCSSPGPGKGSTFWFTLPLAPGHVDPLSKQAPPDDERKEPKRNLNPGVGERADDAANEP